MIDTVGIKADRPFAIVDAFGTPYSSALHVVERYSLLEYEDAKDALSRNAKENFDLNEVSALPVYVDPNYRASTCNSNSRSRMKASSRGRGRRP